ncbi:MAG: extradiol dioxygenase [Candidatus Bathyarchaeota archaeon]|nr:extradiol dioxygenase [Candidatus Bathyarchaeota archaeon]
MGIVYACIAPHGAEVIPKLAGQKAQAFGKTTAGMEKLAEQLGKNGPSTIVLATPHGLRLDHTIGVVTTEFSSGSLTSNRKSVRMRYRCDQELAHGILAEAKKLGLTVVGANFGASEGPASCMPMDWGTLIPLWFFQTSRKGAIRRKIVIVTPSREIPLSSLVKFGEAIAMAAQKMSKKVAFVASADQGHAHEKGGPYGFHPASKEYDKLVERAVKDNTLIELLDLKKTFVDDAKPDSLWQIAILVGVLKRVQMEASVISYQAPTYYGMLCASFQRTGRASI